MSGDLFRRRPRHLILPNRGRLMVSTDLHGNLGDLTALCQRFDTLRASGEEVHWVLLGDYVHGPNEEVQRAVPEVYGYVDESWAVVEKIAVLKAQYPNNVHVVLGNHDHGHVGGIHTSKFYMDEVAHLESRLNPAQKRALQKLFAEALLVVIAPCGLVMAHGSPDMSLMDPRQVDELSLRYADNGDHGQWLLSTLTTSYGQPDDVSAAMLACVSQSMGMDLGVVVHGHDRDEVGFFREGDHQLCLVLFGAKDADKRFLLVDLSAWYGGAGDLHEDEEILRVHASLA